MGDKLVLIDGHSIINRAFYGVPDLTNAKGLHTNAIYGFLNILFKILEEEKPQYLAVAFDLKAPTFRHKMYDAYKGTRKPMPQELREQVPVLKEVLRAMDILTMEQEGYEADDILGTMARRAEASGVEVALVSGDRDLLQIATDHIKIRIPKTKGGRTEIEDYYAKDVLEAYHVTPLQFIELKALMGDTADNIPGVPKVGEKTATSLMETYGSIDEIYNHLDEITKKSIHDTLAANRELADLSKELATICIDAPISYTLEQATMSQLFTKEAYAYFKDLEFRNMLAKFDGVETAEKEIPAAELISDLAQVDAFFATVQTRNKIAFYWLDEIGIVVQTEEQPATLLQIGGFVTEGYLQDKLGGLLEAIKPTGAILIGFDVKKDYRHFGAGIEAVSKFFDVKLAAYLNNPLKSEYTLADVAKEFGDIVLEDYKQLFGKKKSVDAFAEEEEKYLGYLGKILYSIYESYEPLSKKLNETGQRALYDEIEMPLSYVLQDMEHEGVLVKGQQLAAYSTMLAEKIDVLEQKIYDGVGEKFNINSPKQLGEILFEKMQLKGGKKTKTGYSTAADVLEKLAPDYPVVADILEYRGLTKLKSTYADGLADYIEEDGRIHTNFNQMITATGRISSTEPNLQNIPMRTEMGRQIRKVFVPKDGCVFVDADYSQIELRILAHMSEDQELIEAYRQSEDIHRITASKVFGIPFEEVTDLQRRSAKAVNFGIVYGISSFGLSQDLNLSRAEAKAYIDQYFATYPGIKNYLDTAVETAKQTGESRTLYGRRRPMPELASSNFMQRQFGERVAMNAPIQGTAADIMKIAMIKVYRAMKEAGLRSRILLQVHDELLIECYEDEVAKVQEILQENMKGAASLAVDLEIDVHTGTDWYEAK